jgi:glycosyltransferase involved in cell wall biosynthesis
LEQGTPVVSTDCPFGPREILADGRFGTLVPVNDPDALAVAMLESLRKRHDRDVLQLRAMEFSVDRAADAYLDFLLPGSRKEARI